MPATLHPKSALTLGLVLVLPGLLAVGTPTSANSSDAEVHTEQGEIDCQLRLHLLSRSCSPTQASGAQRHELTVGDQEKVTFQVEWVPQSEDAEELTISLQGNDACRTDADPDCDFEQVTGTSPVELTMTGKAASNVTLAGFVEPVRPCERGTLILVHERCRMPPVILVRDQPYTVTWILE